MRSWSRSLGLDSCRLVAEHHCRNSRARSYHCWIVDGLKPLSSYIQATYDRAHSGTYLDYRIAPPSEISEPWPGNVGQSPSGRTSLMNRRALPHRLQQLLRVEALRGVWREQASCPPKLSALHPQRRERSSVIRAMLELASSLRSERSVAVPMIGGLGTQQALEHGAARLPT